MAVRSDGSCSSCADLPRQGVESAVGAGSLGEVRKCERMEGSTAMAGAIRAITREGSGDDAATTKMQNSMACSRVAAGRWIQWGIVERERFTLVRKREREAREDVVARGWGLTAAALRFLSQRGGA